MAVAVNLSARYYSYSDSTKRDLLLTKGDNTFFSAPSLAEWHQHWRSPFHIRHIPSGCHIQRTCIHQTGAFMNFITDLSSSTIKRAFSVSNVMIIERPARIIGRSNLIRDKTVVKFYQCIRNRCRNVQWHPDTAVI